MENDLDSYIEKTTYGHTLGVWTCVLSLHCGGHIAHTGPSKQYALDLCMNSLDEFVEFHKQQAHYLLYDS